MFRADAFKATRGSNMALGTDMLEYIRVTESGSLPSVRVPKPYKCVVVVEAEVSPSRQMEISRWLVQTGCMYMMAWGVGCSSWDDSVDLANLEPFGFEEIPDEAFVMTTWHESETLEEVFDFSQRHVANIRPILVLQINGVDKERQLVEMAGNA